MRTNNVLLVIFFAILLSACSSLPGMPGHISEHRSSFDESIQLSMEPAFVYRNNNGFSGSDMRFSLLWRSAMDDDEIVLIAYVDGARSFATGDSLYFNVDDEIVRFQAIDEITNVQYEPGIYGAASVPGSSVSSKRYLVSQEFIRQILDASSVGVRLDLRTNFVEGVFNDSTTSSANVAFTSFMQRIDEMP